MLRERINQLALLLRSSPKRTSALAGFLLVILAIPLTVAVSQRQQNVQQEAATSQCAPGEEQCIGNIIYGCHTVGGVGRWDNETKVSLGVDCTPKGATCKPDAGKTRAYSCIANPTTPPPPTGITCAQAGGQCRAGGCGMGSSQIAGDCVATNNVCCSIVSSNPSTCSAQQEKCVNNIVYSCNTSANPPQWNTSGENCSTGGRTCLQDGANQYSCIANCMVSGVGTCRVTVGGNCPSGTQEVSGPSATGCNTGSKCCKPGGSGGVSPTPSGTPPSCTLSANPNRVNINTSSQVTASCTGNPDRFTWSETCGTTNKVNSPQTSWKAPGNPGNCSVSVEACNSFGCSKPSTTIQVVSPSPTPTLSPTPTPAPNATTLLLSIGLDGLGSTGDDINPNPIASSDPIYRSNPDPIHKTRDITVVLKNSSGAVIDSVGSTITFAADGKFKNTITLKPGFPSGTYSVTVNVPNYIEETIVNNLAVSSGAKNVSVAGDLSTGDIDNNNELDILDYNILISCYIYSPNAGACNSNENYRTISDLTDNGVNDHDDYNLHLRDWAARN